MNAIFKTRTDLSFEQTQQRWPRAWGEPLTTGVIRSRSDDFKVEEIPRLQPDEAGEHLWLWVEKRNANSDWVARQLAACANVHGRDIGFAGRKDRYAVTRQFFSLPAPPGAELPWRDWRIDGVEILSAKRHSRKLRRGFLAGNRFLLLLRKVEVNPRTLDLRLQKIAAQGVPNYFGAQRFGHQGRNLAKAGQLMFEGRSYPRNVRNLLISSVRSYLLTKCWRNASAGSNGNA